VSLLEKPYQTGHTPIVLDDGSSRQVSTYCFSREPGKSILFFQGATKGNRRVHRLKPTTKPKRSNGQLQSSERKVADEQKLIPTGYVSEIRVFLNWF